MSHVFAGSVALVPVAEMEMLQLAAAEHGLDPETYRKQVSVASLFFLQI